MAVVPLSALLAWWDFKGLKEKSSEQIGNFPKPLLLSPYELLGSEMNKLS